MPRNPLPGERSPVDVAHAEKIENLHHHDGVDHHGAGQFHREAALDGIEEDAEGARHEQERDEADAPQHHPAQHRGSRRRGGRVISLLRGSNANAIDSVTAVTMFTHSICTAVIGSGSPTASAMYRHRLPPLVARMNTIAFRRLS